MGFLFQTFTKKGQKSHKPWNLLRKTTLPCDFEDSGVLKSSSFSNGKYPSELNTHHEFVITSICSTSAGVRLKSEDVFQIHKNARTNLTTG